MKDYTTINLEDNKKEHSHIPVAQYVRMSTEHQRYSTENQRDLIKEYADANNMVIVNTYADDGKSGLSIGGRAALKKPIITINRWISIKQLFLAYLKASWADCHFLQVS